MKRASQEELILEMIRREPFPCLFMEKDRIGNALDLLPKGGGKELGIAKLLNH